MTEKEQTQRTVRKTVQKTATRMGHAMTSVVCGTGKFFWKHKNIAAVGICFAAGLAGVRIGFVVGNKLVR